MDQALRWRVAPLDAELERVIAAERVRQEPVRVGTELGLWPDVVVHEAGARIHAGCQIELRLYAGQLRPREVEQEAAVDVRCRRVDEESIARHPLPSALVGGGRTGLPPRRFERARRADVAGVAHLVAE